MGKTLSLSLWKKVSANDWAENVYKPDIVNNSEKLYKKPGYKMSELA
jgi:4-oxalocrotonate tautomerase